jgi:hypothetical protein
MYPVMVIILLARPKAWVLSCTVHASRLATCDAGHTLTTYVFVLWHCRITRDTFTASLQNWYVVFVTRTPRFPLRNDW